MAPAKRPRGAQKAGKSGSPAAGKGAKAGKAGKQHPQQHKSAASKKTGKSAPAVALPAAAQTDEDDVEVDEESEQAFLSEYAGFTQFLQTLDPEKLKHADEREIGKGGKFRVAELKGGVKRSHEDDDDNEEEDGPELDADASPDEEDEDEDDGDIFGEGSDNREEDDERLASSAAAIQAAMYANKSSADDSTKKQAKKQRVDVENSYEKETRSWIDDDSSTASGRLPIKDAGGKVRVPTKKLEVAPAALEKLELLEKAKEELEKEKEEKEQQQQRQQNEPKKFPIPQDKRGRPLTGALYIEARKIQMASTAQAITENPEQKTDQIRLVMDLMGDNDFTVQSLATLTALAVFKDIIPGYRIRETTEAENSQTKLSKDVKKLRKFENAVIRTYQQFLVQLDKLFKTSKAMRKASTSPEEETIADQLGLLAVQCMCELLVSKPHFNFRANLLNAVISKMTVQRPQPLGKLCCDTVIKLFQTDERGDVALEAVRLIVRLIRAKSFNVHPEVIQTFLHLRLLVELESATAPTKKEEQAAKKRSAKQRRDEHQRGSTDHVSRRQRKLAKADKELQKELDETAAEHSKEDRQRLHRETLKAVFQIYFRILKNMQSSPALAATLQGLARFTHLINVEFFNDLMAVLKSLAFLQSTDLECALSAILTTFQLAQRFGESLTIDLKDFYILFYELVLKLPVENARFVPIALSALELMFYKRKQLSRDRVAAFAKRLSLVSLQMPSHAALATIGVVHTLLQRYPQTQALLETDQAGVGLYLPELDNPDSANAFASTLWELAAMQNHFHPTVARLARRTANGHPGVLGSPNEILQQYDTSMGNFNPPVQQPPSSSKNTRKILDIPSKFVRGLKESASASLV